MCDLSVRGVYRRHIVEPAITFFGTTDPMIVGDPKTFLVRMNVMGGSSGSLRSVLEPLAREEVGPASWYQKCVRQHRRRDPVHPDLDSRRRPDHARPRPRDNTLRSQLSAKRVEGRNRRCLEQSRPHHWWHTPAVEVRQGGRGAMPGVVPGALGNQRPPSRGESAHGIGQVERDKLVHDRPGQCCRSRVRTHAGSTRRVRR
jgi:hypothetical protein